MSNTYTYTGNYVRWTPSAMVSALQLPAHLKLKTRNDTSLSTTTTREEAKQKLELQEAREWIKRGNLHLLSERQRHQFLTAIEHSNKDEDKDLRDKLLEQTNLALTHQSENNLDDDSDQELLSSDDDDNDLSDSSDDEELRRELEAIRSRRERAQKQQQDEQQQIENQQILETGNPLLKPTNQGGNTNMNSNLNSNSNLLKRKWNDDTVFKNQASHDEPQKKKQKRVINDTVRSDYHRSFIHRYMK